MESETDINNKKILLSHIRHEIVEASEELTSLNEDKKKTKKQIQVAEEQLEEIRTASDLEIAAVREEKKQLFEARRELDAAEKRYRKEIQVLKEQKKESMKELRRQNEWVFAAKEELKAVQKETKRLKTLNGKKNELEKEVESLLKQKTELEETCSTVMIEANLKMDAAELKEHKVNEEEKKKVAKLAKIDEELAKAKVSLRETRNKETRINKDLAIYIERVEKHYGKAFPDLKMKL